MFVFNAFRLPEKSISILFALILTACASTPTEHTPWQVAQGITPFQAAGRLAIKADSKGSYAAFDWLRTPNTQIIHIKNPLGQRMGTLCQDTQGFIAQDNRGNIIQAATAAKLSEQLTGFAIPLDSLDIWLLGHYHPNKPYHIKNNVLHQSGWQIQRETREKKPYKLTLNRPNLHIRLIIDTFNTTQSNHEPLCSQRPQP